MGFSKTHNKPRNHNSRTPTHLCTECDTAPHHQNTKVYTQKRVNKVTAVHSGRETPGPIPNPEAKPASADDTTQPGWKSRTPPNTI